MSDDRKKPLWPWIVGLLIGLPVLYVASFGPACWISSRIGAHKGFVVDAVQLVYQPVLRLGVEGPDSVRRGIEWWVTLDAKPNWHIRSSCGPTDDCYWSP